jgi:wyosine [tRNA(Phe)-imidazoG37] synthetase (radical SAM superfamily)
MKQSPILPTYKKTADKRLPVKTTGVLDETNHDRDSAALRYVYPVVSRRAGGVSIGINLNTNNACNWRCIYCQVPGLTHGAAPPVDLTVLENELRDFIHEALQGNFMKDRVPEGARRINDIALSGNGEPTSATEISGVIELIGRVRRETSLPEEVKTVLITNGSFLHRNEVQEGLRAMARINGEVWFKLDRASETGMRLINDTGIRMEKVRANLAAAIALCPTWLQTCWFMLDGEPPCNRDEEDYLEFISALLHDGHKPEGVLLYGLARPPMQPEAERLSAVSEKKMQAFAERIGRLLPVKINT